MLKIEETMALKAQLDELRPLDPTTEAKVMQKLRLDWNYHSNHIEGNSLTFGETKTLLLHGITAQGKPLKDHFEIKGHDEAIKWVLDVIKKEYPLTEVFIRELHQLLLKEPYEVDAKTPDGKLIKKMIQIGQYKTMPNHVETKTGEMFYFASPEETPAKMTDLMTTYQQQKTERNPILLAAKFHYDFVRIHPFDDGNGRMARLLMNFILLGAGFPPVVIKTEDKINYYAALQQADGGNLDPFIDYIAENLNNSLIIMIRAAKGENIEESDDLDKELFLLGERLKGVKTETKQKSSETILEWLNDSFERFYKKAEQAHEKFGKYYENKELKITTQINGFRNTGIQSIQSIRELLIRQRAGSSGDMEYILFEYEYKGFRDSNDKTFEFESRYQFEFKKNEYRVSVGQKNWTKRHYLPLTDSEINEIIKAMSDTHIAAIKGRLDELDNEK
ncbi:MAG: hypothetical protein RL757_2764 [Bacteroidota bacterium]|jgi:Fic family protein